MAGADLRAALVASAFRGALPPVDLRAVCLVRAMLLSVDLTGRPALFMGELGGMAPRFVFQKERKRYLVNSHTGPQLLFNLGNSKVDFDELLNRGGSRGPLKMGDMEGRAASKKMLARYTVMLEVRLA